MNIPESAEDSSCTRQENGDASAGSDRPLKKARFAWQVKGKYHLKNGASEPCKSSNAVSTELDRAPSSSNKETECIDAAGNTEQNLERLGDYLLKQNFNTLDSVITDSENSLLEPSTNLSPDKLPYPRYESSFDNNSSNSMSSGSSQENRLIPMSMVLSASCIEDQCIARWQARQMAKSFIDNTINRVLDSWMVAPLPAEVDSNRLPIALDVAEFIINNLPGDNSIENEGILMAISAHGLQNTSSASSNEESQNNEQTYSYRGPTEDAFLSPPSSPIQSEDKMRLDTVKLKPRDDGASTDELAMVPWYSEDDKKIESDVNSFSFFPESSTSSYQYFTESDQLQSSGIDYDTGGNINSSGADILNSHYDFLDAAVSFAIQNKGLTSFGSDYG